MHIPIPIPHQYTPIYTCFPPTRGSQTLSCGDESAIRTTPRSPDHTITFDSINPPESTTTRIGNLFPCEPPYLSLHRAQTAHLRTRADFVPNGTTAANKYPNKYKIINFITPGIIYLI